MGPIVINYSRSSITGAPLFSYKDAENDLNFSGTEITQVGNLVGEVVTVRLQDVTDVFRPHLHTDSAAHSHLDGRRAALQHGGNRYDRLLGCLCPGPGSSRCPAKVLHPPIEGNCAARNL